MEDLIGVDVEEPLKELLHQGLDLRQVEGHVAVGQEPRQVVLAELKDQVEDGGRSADAAASADLVQGHHVLVVHLFQDPDLSDGCDGETLFLVLHQNLWKVKND